MKLSAWAKQQGISYRTAWNRYKAGQLPVPVRQTATGTILVEVAAPKAASVRAALGADAALYGQVERALFADIARGADPAALKSEYLIRDGLTARQYNAIAMNLKGTIDAIKARRCVFRSDPIAAPEPPGPDP